MVYIIILLLDVNFNVDIIYLFFIRCNWWVIILVKDKLRFIYLYKLVKFLLIIVLV